jgi:hypothetical protein
MKNEEITLRERLSVCHIYDPEAYIGSLSTFSGLPLESIQLKLLKDLKIHALKEDILPFIVKQEVQFIGRNVRPYIFVQRTKSDTEWACPKCLEIKAPGEFKVSAGLCNNCKKIIDKRYRENNKEYIKKYTMSENFVYAQLRSQAKARGIVFTLDPVFYMENLANKPCHYCGLDNTRHWVDRYINDHKIGYTNENSVPCCQLCNRMKVSLDPSVFIDHCKKITEFNNNKLSTTSSLHPAINSV